MLELGKLFRGHLCGRRDVELAVSSAGVRLEEVDVRGEVRHRRQQQTMHVIDREERCHAHRPPSNVDLAFSVWGESQDRNRGRAEGGSNGGLMDGLTDGSRSTGIVLT